ncbi:IST1-like protein [Tanacetum coccineum]
MFGWSKASECKKAIMEKLIKLGESETAFERAHQVYKDEGMIVVYELLALFCEHISFHLSRIRRKKNCPKEVMEAVSSLMFASARCKPHIGWKIIFQPIWEEFGDQSSFGKSCEYSVSSAIDVYDDIQEFKSPLNKDSNQRGFLFVSSPLSGHEKTMERGMSMPCKRSATMPLDDKSLKKSYSLLSQYVESKSSCKYTE